MTPSSQVFLGMMEHWNAGSIPSLHYFIVPLFHCSTISLFHYFIVPLFHCSIISLFHYSITPTLHAFPTLRFPIATASVPTASRQLPAPRAPGVLTRGPTPVSIRPVSRRARRRRRVHGRRRRSRHAARCRSRDP